jgi:hypothetical protein
MEQNHEVTATPQMPLTFGIKLMTALSGFQSDCPTIEKSKSGYGYKYAELSTIVETIRPILKKHKMGFTQHMLGSDVLRTIVFHFESGEYIQTDTKIPSGVELKGMNLFQTDGAKYTYYKRYCITSILGIVTDDDIDARGQVKPDAEEPTKKKKLNDKQFISMIGAINNGTYSMTDAKANFELTPEQIISLDSIQQ